MAVVLGMSACGGYTVGFMWVPGTQYNQIAGLKIDDYTGNLTAMVNSPYSSGGSNPVSIAVRTGGNFVFIVNKGVNATSSACTSAGQALATGQVCGNVAVFAVGEDGVLTFQATYTTAGGTPVWAATDGTGSFLYVLDSQSPDFATTGNGDITVFGVDGSTGRLQLIPNQLIKNAAGQQLGYFEVGPVPTTMRVGGQCLYTLDSGDQSIYSYGLGGGGQLTITPTSKYKPTPAYNLTSLNVTGSTIYITDAGSPLSTGGAILPFTAGSGCSLSPQAGGLIANLATTSNPVYSLTDSKGKFLYVVNHSSTNPQYANSTISAFSILPGTGELVQVSDPQNPYPIGNGPVCMVEDPSGQYVYTSNSNDGTVSGRYINSQTGQLSDLPRGSSFQATGLATCLAVSGNVD
jgi:6-phosphogluconolactonase (cycloisomerase 2 family)